MNTNNAPERIELGNGYYLMWNRGCNCYYIHDPKGSSIGEMYGNEVEFAAAMQPQVSESDEAVAREICYAVNINSSYSESFGVSVHDEAIAEVANILARHRQPAAVSAAMMVDTDLPLALVDFGNFLDERRPTEPSNSDTIDAVEYQFGLLCGRLFKAGLLNETTYKMLVPEPAGDQPCPTAENVVK